MSVKLYSWYHSLAQRKKMGLMLMILAALVAAFGVLGLLGIIQFPNADKYVK